MAGRTADTEFYCPGKGTTNVAQDARPEQGQPERSNADSIADALRSIEGTMIDVDPNGAFAGQQPAQQQDQEPDTPPPTDPPAEQEEAAEDNLPEDRANLDFASLPLEERAALVRRVAEEDPLALANGFMRDKDYRQKTMALKNQERAMAPPPPAQQQPQVQQHTEKPDAKPVYPHQFDASSPADITQFDRWMQDNYGRQATEADVAGLVAARAVEPVTQQLEELTARQQQAQVAAAEQQVGEAAKTLMRQYPEVMGDPQVQQRLGEILDNLDPGQVTADVVISLFHGTFHDRVDEVRDLRSAEGRQRSQQEEAQTAAGAQPPPSGAVPPGRQPEPKTFEELNALMLGSDDLLSAVEDTLEEEGSVYSQHLKR